MSVTIKIASALRGFTGNKEAVAVKGETIHACLEDLAVQYPEVKKFLFDSHDMPMVFVLFHGEPINAKKLDKKIKDGDEFEIYMIMGGG